MDLSKKSKREKQLPNFIIFLVEGQSDQIALENPLSELIFGINPDYEVRFLLQQRPISKSGNEVNDRDDNDDDSNNVKYEYGGDITASYYVEPKNIENKITRRFITPATKMEGLYPKQIAKIIQIVDIDGAYLTDDRIIKPKHEHNDIDKTYYNEINGVIETWDIDSIIDRNDRKRKNIDYLLTLSKEGIKIKTKKIPYEIYFFSSNLDHVINHNPNIEEKKNYYAGEFLRKYGLDLKKYCDYFFSDPSSIGYMGYEESWLEVKKGINSIKRLTNIDCLIRKLMNNDLLMDL